MTTDASVEPAVYTVQELERIFRCSLPTAYKAVRENIVPNFRIGTRYYIPRIALDELLACREQMKKLREKLET